MSAGTVAARVRIAFDAGAKTATVHCRAREIDVVIERDLVPELEPAGYRVFVAALDAPEAVHLLILEIERAAGGAVPVAVVLAGVGALVDDLVAARMLRACVQRHDDVHTVFVSDRDDDLEKLLRASGSPLYDHGGVWLTAGPRRIWIDTEFSDVVDSHVMP